MMLSLRLASNPATCQPGKDLRIQPQLYTGDGLLINMVSRGAQASPIGLGDCNAQVVVATLDGQVLDRHLSGFA